jgi:hypothetical protein
MTATSGEMKLDPLLLGVDTLRTRLINITNMKPSRWWLSDKSLGSRGLLSLWSQVQAMWLLI